MPRPRIPRISTVAHPRAFSFRPVLPENAARITEVTFTRDEYEALVLSDHVHLSHEEIGLRMGVSRATASRIVYVARQKMAGVLRFGHPFKIEEFME